MSYVKDEEEYMVTGKGRYFQSFWNFLTGAELR